MNSSESTLKDSSILEANRRLGHHFFAEQDRLRGGPEAALCTPDYSAVIGSAPAMDRAGHEGFAQAFYRGFPDVYHTVEEVIAAEDAAVVRFVLRGTHTSDFFGLQPTGRAVVVPAQAILRVQNGKVRKLSAIFDEAGMLRQLGVLPG